MVNSEQSQHHDTPAETARVEGTGPLGAQGQATGQSAAERAREQAERQKERAADRIADVASELRDRGSRLRDGQTTQKITGAAAESMDRASDFLHERGTGDMLEKVRSYTRAHPGTALLVAGMAGLVFGRKLFR